MMTANPDFLIIGAGIIGLTIGREIQCRYPGMRVTIVEKEQGSGKHASGRNSGVLHSGIYYTADSLKARFTRDGNKAWQAYCTEKKLALDPCGKLVVVRNEAEWAGLETLIQRGERNGVEIRQIDAHQAREIQPGVRTAGRALFIPSTATVDPGEVVRSVEADFKAAGGSLLLGCSYRRRISGNTVETDQGRLSPGFVINCAGLQADRVAHDFGFGLNYTLLPFKGLYLYAEAPGEHLRTHIYPVPDLRNPFLGVHFTRTVDGHTKIGPTAIPAFWREQYDGMSGFRPGEMLSICFRELRMFLADNNGFRRLALRELGRQGRSQLAGEAAGLLDGVEGMRFRRWGKPGIRAQLLDLRTYKLEMDFVIEGDSSSMHVLNAVSPAFTCAIPFAGHVLDSISGHRSSTT